MQVGRSILVTGGLSCGPWSGTNKVNICYVFLSIFCQVKPGDRAHNQAHYEALGEVKDLADMK